MNKKISVIIPAHNEERYIYKTLEYLKSNSINPFEIIVVCDACEDKTKEIASNYTNLIFDVDFHSGSKTRNFGVSKSSGDIVVFIDADTLVSSNYLEEIIKVIDNYDYGCAKTLSEHKGLFSKYIAWSTNNYYKKNIGGNFFIKKDVFVKVGGFNEVMKRGEDTDLGDRLKKEGFRKGFLKMCYIILSDRRYKDSGYLWCIIKSGISGFLYKFFRSYYNKRIGSKFYE
jgi:cellulose synthase/poly-beta-1,6-N-acetylglucosamine synthase-like glycosyltransferase